MADINLKTETPDTTLPTTGFLFGADSQAAASPSVYPVANAITTILGNAASADLLSFNSDLILGRRAAANFQLGLPDAAAPVAQTLSVQSVVTGTSNTAGQEFRIDGSQGTGTGAGGSLVFRVAPVGLSGSAVNALATAFTIDGGTGLIRSNLNGFDVNNSATVLFGAQGTNIIGRPGASTTLTFGSNLYWQQLEFYTAGTRRWYFDASGHFLAGADNAYDIGASGATRPRNVFVAGNVTANTVISFITRVTNINNNNNQNTVLTLTDNSDNLLFATGGTSPRINFCGTTSSFPALKRNSTALETKLADDSAYAPHAMQYLDVTDGITAPASATGRARIYVDTADGDLKVIFADGTVKTIVTDT